MEERLKRWRSRADRLALWLYGLTISLGVLLIASGALAAGGGKPATKLINVADTRDLTGLAKMVGDLYNGNLWVFGLVVVVTMAGMGLILGLGFDRLIGLLGIDLGKIDHHE